MLQPLKVTLLYMLDFPAVRAEAHVRYFRTAFFPLLKEETFATPKTLVDYRLPMFAMKKHLVDSL